MKLKCKRRFLHTCKLIQLNRKTAFEGKPRNSEITRLIQQNANVSYAETVNQVSKYLRGFTKYLPRTLNGSTLDRPQLLASVAKSFVSDVAGDLGLPSELKKTLEKAKRLRCMVIRPSLFLVGLLLCPFKYLPLF